MTDRLQHQHKRIEYLDALRGFTMILVVIHHVYNYTFGFNEEQIAGSYNYIFQLFHMPLFFFVAGFVFYKKDTEWNIENSFSFLKKKVSVLILSPLLFWLAYVIVKNVDIAQSILSINKSGYWFTFTLFEYFILYIVFQSVARSVKIKGWVNDILLICYGFAIIALPYALKFIANPNNGGLANNVMAIIGIENFRLFLFFVFGTLIRKHFTKFEDLLDNKNLVIYCLVLFIAINIITPNINAFDKMIQIVFKLFLGICAIVITFSFFRRYQSIFGKDKLPGKVLQFVGRRTLDIYLLHYFFLPTGLREKLNVLSDFNMPILDFSMAILLAAIIICACLAVSSVLRMHQGMAHFLFGAKKK